MAKELFNIYSGGNGSYSTSYGKIDDFSSSSEEYNSLIFDTARHSIWTHGVEFGYNVSNIVSVSKQSDAIKDSSTKTNTDGKSRVFISGISVSNDKDKITVSYTSYPESALGINSNQSTGFVHSIAVNGHNISYQTISASDVITSNNKDTGYIISDIVGSDIGIVITYSAYTYVNSITTTNTATGYQIKLGRWVGGDISDTIPILTESAYGVAKSYYGKLSTDKAIEDRQNKNNRYYGVEQTKDNKLIVNIPWVDHYVDEIAWTDKTDGKELILTRAGEDSEEIKRVLKKATNSAYGVLKTYFSTLTNTYAVQPETYIAGRYYGLSIEADGKAVTNVPWINTYTYKAEWSDANTGKTLTLTYHKDIGSSVSDDTFTATLPKMTASSYGIAKTGFTEVNSNRQFPVSISTDGKLYTTVTQMSDSKYGVAKTGFTTNATDRNYKVSINNSDNLYTNVPWINTYTYKAAWSDSNTGKTLTLTYHKDIGSSVSDGTFTTTLPVMTNLSFGVAKSYYSASSAVNVKDVSSTAGRYYGIQTNPDGKLIVNVPLDNPVVQPNESNETYYLTFVEGQADNTSKQLYTSYYYNRLSFNPDKGTLHVCGASGVYGRGGKITFGDVETEAYLGELNDQELTLYGDVAVSLNTHDNNIFINNSDDGGIVLNAHNDKSVVINAEGGLIGEKYNASSTYWSINQFGKPSFNKWSNSGTPSNLHPILHATETNYIDQIKVVSSPETDVHTLYIVI